MCREFRLSKVALAYREAALGRTGVGGWVLCSLATGSTISIITGLAAC